MIIAAVEVATLSCFHSSTSYITRLLPIIRPGINKLNTQTYVMVDFDFFNQNLKKHF